MSVHRKTNDGSEPGAEPMSDESGQGLVEYGLILALIAVVCLTALGALGGAIVSSPGWSIFTALG